MTIILENISQLFMFMICGFILGKSKIVNSEHTKILSALGVYLFLPCTVFNAFLTNFTVKNLTQYYKLILISIVLLLIFVTFAHLISRLLSKDSYERNVYKYTLIISNYGYMGSLTVCFLQA